MSANRFEPAPPEPGPPRRRFGSLKVTGRSRRPGIYAREAIAPICQIDLATTDRAATLTVQGQMDIFNSFNNGYVKTETRTWGTSLGVPTSNLQPRTLRLAVQMRF